MFCDLNGAVRRPSCLKIRHNAVVTILFPTSEAVPRIIKTAPWESNCPFIIWPLPPFMLNE
ncbi:hypothetical protein D3C71_591340 [compost metagenome]